MTHTYASADTTPTIQASATDENGTYLAGNTVQVSVVSTPADVTPPTAALTAGNVSSAGGSSYSFSVVFSDDQGVLASDLNDSDVMILGPNGFSQAGHLVSLDSNSNGTPRSATYSISAPGGSWNYTANGSYAVNLNSNAVHDINGNAAAGGTLGSFKVAAPVPDLGGTSLDTAQYMGIMDASYNQTILDFVSKTDRHDYSVTATRWIAGGRTWSCETRARAKRTNASRRVSAGGRARRGLRASFRIEGGSIGRRRSRSEDQEGSGLAIVGKLP